MRRPDRAAPILVLLVLALPALAAEPTPVGPEFLVNTYTTSDQERSVVGVDADGDFVVAWQSNGSADTDTSVSSIQAQRFGSDGVARGGELQVNTYTTSRQEDPALAVEPDGDFVVVWESNGSAGTDASQSSIQGQRFGSDGVARGGEFQVNSYTTSSQDQAAVAVEADGDFVVLWTSAGSPEDDTSLSIQGQRFGSDGQSVDSQFQVNSYTTSGQYQPSVGFSDDGGFVVAWSSGRGAFDLISVQGQRFGSDGLAVASEFQVSEGTTGIQNGVSLAVEPDGDFVAAWFRLILPGDNSVLVRRFGSDGSARGAQFRVNADTTEDYVLAGVAVDPDGEFVVAWRRDDDDLFTLEGQRYEADGEARGSVFEISPAATVANLHSGLALAGEAAGDFVVTWSSAAALAEDEDGKSIKGRRFTSAIFADGFESGDECLWTSSVGRRGC